MVSSNIDSVVLDFNKIKERINQRLIQMATTFAYQVTVSAIDDTPFGTKINPDGTINMLYENPARIAFFGSDVPGVSKAGWQLRVGAIAYGGRKPMPAKSQQATEIKQDAGNDLRPYQLGQTIFISNKVPYVVQDNFFASRVPSSLEGGYSNQAPDGIMKPTLQMISTVYALNLAKYYKGI